MTRLTFEYDSEPYGKERDGAIIKMANEFGVETIVKNSHTLYSLDRSIRWSQRAPMSIQDCQDALFMGKHLKFAYQYVC